MRIFQQINIKEITMMPDFDIVSSTLNFICTFNFMYCLLLSQINLLLISDILNPQYVRHYVYLKAVKLICIQLQDDAWCLIILAFKQLQSFHKWEFNLYFSYQPKIITLFQKSSIVQTFHLEEIIVVASFCVAFRGRPISFRDRYDATCDQVI